MLLLDTVFGEVLKALLGATPWSASIYGLLVAVLFYFNWRGRKDLNESKLELKQEREYSEKVNKEVLQLAKSYVENSVRLEQAIKSNEKNDKGIEELILHHKELFNRFLILEDLLKSNINQ